MKQSRQENLTYLAVWGLLFAAPVLSQYVRTVSDANLTFDWTEVFVVWRLFAVYLVLFLIHNFLLAPMLVHRRRHTAYFSLLVVVIAAFVVFQCSNRPRGWEHGRGRPPMEQHGNERPSFDEPPMKMEGERPPMPDKHPHRRHTPPPIVGEHDILALVTLLLMFGANLGIKVYFRSREDRQRLAELEKQNLEQQLEYLRYQINPHFFMNTLNNIHALVDIDPEKAKDTILELSKMMRYVLYEGNKQGVPISRELDFIRHYVALMQLRYTDKVRISVDLPSEVPDRKVPPLMLITFIENAFKHGVSYQKESFIEVKVDVKEDRLLFSCRNSKADKSNEEKGGVGLANVKERLNLLYNNDYTLHIDNTPDIYTVELIIPITQ
jgi:two-component sensor histidine kinase